MPQANDDIRWKQLQEQNQKIRYLRNTDQTNQVLPPFLQELKKCVKTKPILTFGIKLIFAIT